MNAQTLWFEWTRDEPIDLTAIDQAVQDGGMGISEIRLMGEFVFGDDWVQLKDERGPKLEYGGKKLKDGKWDIEVVGYEDGEEPIVFRIQAFKQPEKFQN